MSLEILKLMMVIIWELGKKWGGRRKELLKKNLLFLDDKTFIHAEHDEVQCIITDEKSSRFSNRLFQPKKWDGVALP